MQPQTNFSSLVITAIVSGVFVLVICSIVFLTSYMVLASSREHEIEVLRQEYTSLLERHSRQEDIELGRLREQLNTNEFINQKRHQLVLDELTLIKKKSGE